MTETSDGDVKLDKIEGTTRIQSAWSGDSSTQGQALAAGSVVYEQIYRPWNGELGGRWIRNFSIWRHHVYGIFIGGHKPWSIVMRLATLLLFLGAMYDLLIVFIASLSGEESLLEVVGIKRTTLFNQVLGYFPRNAICFPLIAAMLAGGLISEDRRHGMSAVYFSRPISRIDYAAMKYLSMASVLGAVVLITLTTFYVGSIALTGEGWNFLLETFPLYLFAMVAGTMLVLTYTSIGMALSSLSRGRYLPGVSFIALLIGTRILAGIIDGVFNRTILYVLSPFDVVAHLGQVMMGIPSKYDHSWTLSLVSMVLMNAIPLYVLAVRITSMEVTRE